MVGILEVGNLRANTGEKINGYWKIAETPSSDISIPIFLINGKGKGPTLTITAGSKPCVYAGIEACIRISKMINPNELNGNIITCPVLDIPSFNTITPDVCAIDLKPIPRAPNEMGSISNIIGKARSKLMSMADYSVDLHGGDLDENLIEGIVISGWTGDVSYDEKVIQMVKWFMPKAWQRRPIRTPINVPNILIESGGGGKLEEHQIEFHIKGLLNVMKGLGMIDGELEASIQPEFVYGIGRRYEIRAGRGGIYYSKVFAGDHLTKGQVIGKIGNLFGEIVETICSPVTGRIIAYWDENKVLNTGDIIGVVYSSDNEKDYTIKPPKGWINK
jgi:predicted deacylase